VLTGISAIVERLLRSEVCFSPFQSIEVQETHQSGFGSGSKSVYTDHESRTRKQLRRGQDSSLASDTSKRYEYAMSVVVGTSNAESNGN
jgi:hypothetical protein